jgi:thioesterase domain-containing protein
LSEIPLKPSGKIDRSKLPAPQRRTVSEDAGRAHSRDEELLVALWRQSLDDPQAGPETCFYAAGGTSLGAVRLCCAVERRTGKVLDIGSLAVHSTPRKLAAQLFKGSGNQSRGAMHLNSGLDALTLFCISGQVWNPRSLRNVASHLTGTATAVGVRLPGLSGGGAELADTRATARYAVKQLRDHQAHGPYYLLGYSYGGVIAFEACNQLRAAGETVGALVLLDAHLPSKSGYYKAGWQRALIHARHMIRGGPQLAIRRARDRNLREKVRRNASLTDDEATRLHKRAQELCEQAFLSYHPEPYDGDVLLLRPTEVPDFLHFTHTLTLGGWPTVIRGELRLESISGHHYTMLDDPHAEEVAAKVRDYLVSVGAIAAPSFV